MLHKNRLSSRIHENADFVLLTCLKGEYVGECHTKCVFGFDLVVVCSGRRQALKCYSVHLVSLTYVCATKERPYHHSIDIVFSYTVHKCIELRAENYGWYCPLDNSCFVSQMYQLSLTHCRRWNCVTKQIEGLKSVL